MLPSAKRLNKEARPDWGSAYVLLPWYLYNFYGDADVFTRHYEHLKAWIHYVSALREEGVVVRGYGDWCPPGGNTEMECPPPLTSTAFFYGTLNIMQVFAKQLGKTDDVTAYARLAAETRAAFHKKFFQAETGGYGSQTADAIALRFAIYPEGQGSSVAKALRNEIVDRHQGHAFVGIHGGRPLYTQLCENGYEDVAFAAMRDKTFPSFRYTLDQGHTTWPEVQFKSDLAMPRTNRLLNHPMQSGFASWFHESLGGIRPAAPGFKRIELKPHGYTQLAWAKVTHDSLYGPIKSEWRVETGKFVWQVSIPPNTTARVYVPVKQGGAVTESGMPIDGRRGVKFLAAEDGRNAYDVESGSYRFQAEI